MTCLDKNALEASVCRDSLQDFVQRFWDVICPERMHWNWHMGVICDVLQEAAERVFRGEPKKYDLVINVPPGSSKSIIASQMFPAWCWTRMPSCKFIMTSYATALALRDARLSRMLIDSTKYIRLFGDMELRDDQNSKSDFENGSGGFRFSAGIDGAITGRHAHFIGIDDPVNPEEAVSEPKLATANRVVTVTLPSRKVDKQITVTYNIQQRLHQDDPSGRLIAESLRENGTPIKHIKLPGEITSPKQVKPRKYARFYKDGLLDPVRHTRASLKAALARMGQYGYAGQYLQEPAPLGGGMFQVDKIVIEQPPHLRHFAALARYWDKAGTKDGGAWTAGVLMGLDKRGHFWVLDVIRGQWDSAVRERRIKQTAQADEEASGDGKKRRVQVGVEQEPGSGGKESAQATARNLAGYLVRLDPAKGDKVTRADPFSVQVNSENVSMAPGPWNKVYIDEFALFPNSKYKDQVDASSGAFALLATPQQQAGVLF